MKQEEMLNLQQELISAASIAGRNPQPLKELGRKMGMLHPDKDELLLPPSLAEYPPEIVGRMIAELIDIRGGTEFHEPRIQRKVALFIVTVIRPENQGKIIAGLRKTSRASTQFADLIEAEI